MHVVRAQKGDKSREIGLRTFFLNKHKQMLQDGSIMQNIETLGRFWHEEEVCSKYSLKSLQFYNILDLTESEYWKCLDSAYYMYCLEKGKDYFKNHEEFLMRLCAHLLLYSISKKTISFKNVIYNAYTSLYKTGTMDFHAESKDILEGKILSARKNERNFRNLFNTSSKSSKKLTKVLLALNMYLKYPKEAVGICDRAQIEHIFPQTTQWRRNYTGWDKTKAKPFLESLGNKMLLEKPLNIKASNGYFDDKKVQYAKSNFLEAQALAKLPQDDWLQQDIEARNEEIYTRLHTFFKQYAI